MKTSLYSFKIMNESCQSNISFINLHTTLNCIGPTNRVYMQIPVIKFSVDRDTQKSQSSLYNVSLHYSSHVWMGANMGNCHGPFLAWNAYSSWRIEQSFVGGKRNLWRWKESVCTWLCWWQHYQFWWKGLDAINWDQRYAMHILARALFTHFFCIHIVSFIPSNVQHA